MNTLYPIIRRKRRPLIMEEGKAAVVPAMGLVVPTAMTPPPVERRQGEAVTKRGRPGGKGQAHE